MIYQGVLSCLPVFNKKVLLIDIGGGSTEFVIGKRREALFAASLRLGAVRLTRRFFTREKTDAASIMECRSHIAGQLDRVAPSINAEEYDAVVGSSGTIFNIARMIGYKRDGTRYSKKDRLSFSKEHGTSADAVSYDIAARLTYNIRDFVITDAYCAADNHQSGPLVIGDIL